ncbi:hypothetical protein B0H10DRAFT_2209664 [Mycena sp. CBHHK59/15]|nr:hypothetical protein B0H10DRAFT_2209664 [Mycena sp. CBHHK59/15]
MKATDYRDYHLKLRTLCGEAGMKLLSGADGTKSEVNAQQLMMNAETEEHLSYTNPTYGVFLSAPIYLDTGPHICTTDPDHARKTSRNNFLYGMHFLIMGIDIFNADKQDDGAARQLFTDILFGFLLDSEGKLKHPSLEGVFILTFVFGELFDAWMKHSMPHIECITCVFRARHFLTIWRSNIIKAELRYPDLFQKQRSFLADSSFLIIIQLCDQFILLTLAHLEYYPDVPFMPWHHGTHFLKHFFGIARSFITDFSFRQLVEMYKHILIRARILASGQYSTKKEKDSNNGYSFDFVDSGLTPEEITVLKDIPSRLDIDHACKTAWNEASVLASQFAKMEIPTLPLKSSDLDPKIRTANGPSADEPDDELSEEEEVLEQTPLGLNPKAFESEMVRVPHSTAPTALSIDNSLPGSSLSPAEAMAHASHHILTEQYFADAADECEAELARIEKRLNDNPLTDKTISGCMLIANLLNPILVPYGPGMRPIPMFINVGTPVSRTDLVAQHTRHCAGTNVHSEATRQPQTDVRYLDGKFSLIHTAHQLKEAVEQSEGLRTETAFQKG